MKLCTVLREELKSPMHFCVRLQLWAVVNPGNGFRFTVGAFFLPTVSFQLPNHPDNSLFHHKMSLFPKPNTLLPTVNPAAELRMHATRYRSSNRRREKTFVGTWEGESGETFLVPRVLSRPIDIIVFDVIASDRSGRGSSET